MQLLAILFFLFSSYFISVLCNERKDRLKTIVFIIIFCASVTALYIFYPPNITPDYVYYTQSYDYTFKEAFVFKDFLISVQYELISLFTTNKEQTVLVMFFLLKFYFLVFAIWLVYTEIEMYKKMLFFSVMYFFCSSVLLRNGPGYLLVFVGLYYLFRKNRRVLVFPLLAILCHFSALLSVVSFIKVKRNKHFIFKSFVIVVIAFLLVFFNILDVSLFVKKIKAYSSLDHPLNLYHKIWLIFIIGITILSFIENKTRAINSNIWVYIALYIILLFVHVAPAFRVSLYLLIVYCNLPVTELRLRGYIPKVNTVSYVLIIIYIISFFKTHHIDIMLS